MPACSDRKCPSSFEEGGRFVSSPHRRHRRGQPLSSPPFHRFGPCLPAPRLFVPRLPRCGCRLPLLLSPRLPRCGCPATAAFGYRGTARTATLPAWSEMPPRPVFLQLFYGTSHSRSPSLLCPEHKKADGTALRSVRRQKATNLSRQHHRGRSSTRQVSARA